MLKKGINCIFYSIITLLFSWFIYKVSSNLNANNYSYITLFVLVSIIGVSLFYIFNKKLQKYFTKQPTFLFGIIVTLSTTILFFLNSKYPLLNVDEVGKDLINSLISISITLLLLSLEVYQKYRINRKELIKLKEKEKLVNDILSIDIEHLKNYSQKKLDGKLRVLYNNIFGLMGNGFVGKLEDKIEILEELLIYESESEIKSFKATTLNKPSDMWGVNEKFWTIQKDEMKELNEENKIRLVIISPKDLDDEINNKTDILKEFIYWHVNNRFDLRFILTTEEMFRNAVKHHITEHNLLNDFAIINNSIVYGEDNETKYIKLLIKDSERKDNIISEYHKFFNQILDRSIHNYGWSERSAKQILNECNRMLEENEYSASDILKAYDKIIKDNNISVSTEIAEIINKEENITGDEYNVFLTGLFKSMAIKNDELIALDLTPAKTSFFTWVHDSQYLDWMISTIDVANNGCKVSRLFVVDEMEDESNIELIVDQIFLPQINAGVVLYVVSEFELFDKDIPYFDMLLIKNKLGHSLNIGQTLINNDDNTDNPDVCIESNLEHPNSFKRYENAFERIINNSEMETKVKFDNTMSRDELVSELSDFYTNKLYMR